MKLFSTSLLALALTLSTQSVRATEAAVDMVAPEAAQAPAQAPVDMEAAPAEASASVSTVQGPMEGNVQGAVERVDSTEPMGQQPTVATEHDNVTDGKETLSEVQNEEDMPHVADHAAETVDLSNKKQEEVEKNSSADQKIDSELNDILEALRTRALQVDEAGTAE